MQVQLLKAAKLGKWKKTVDTIVYADKNLLKEITTVQTLGTAKDGYSFYTNQNRSDSCDCSSN